MATRRRDDPGTGARRGDGSGTASWRGDCSRSSRGRNDASRSRRNPIDSRRRCRCWRVEEVVPACFRSSYPAGSRRGRRNGSTCRPHRGVGQPLVDLCIRQKCPDFPRLAGVCRDDQGDRLRATRTLRPPTARFGVVHRDPVLAIRAHSGHGDPSTTQVAGNGHDGIVAGGGRQPVPKSRSQFRRRVRFRRGSDHQFASFPESTPKPLPTEEVPSSEVSSSRVSSSNFQNPGTWNSET